MTKRAQSGPPAVSLRVRLTPRAVFDRVDGVGPDGELLVRVTAAPVDGAANAALVRVVAREFGLPPSAVRLLPAPARATSGSQ